MAVQPRVPSVSSSAKQRYNFRHIFYHLLGAKPGKSLVVLNALPNQPVYQRDGILLCLWMGQHAEQIVAVGGDAYNAADIQRCADLAGGRIVDEKTGWSLLLEALCICHGNSS